MSNTVLTTFTHRIHYTGQNNGSIASLVKLQELKLIRYCHKDKFRVIFIILAGFSSSKYAQIYIRVVYALKLHAITLVSLQIHVYNICN